jgi:hypothetical protein
MIQRSRRKPFHFFPTSLNKRSPRHNYFIYNKQTNKSVHKKMLQQIQIVKARKLPLKINKSSIATWNLIKLSEKKLLSDVSTLLSSNFLLMDDMYTLRKPINDVCEILGWNARSDTDWTLLKHRIDLLEPFISYTHLMSSDKYVMFTSAVQCIKELKLHLEESA